MNHDAEIARLKILIAQQETELADLEAEIIDLERDLRAVVERYDELIAPKNARLDIIKRMIADLEHELAQRTTQQPEPPPSSPYTTWKPPADYVPVEEQFRRVWQTPPGDTGPAAPSPFAGVLQSETPDGSDLKRLYRELARRYHPDLTTDAAERERRNSLMADINAAYSDGDIDALRALAAQPQDTSAAEPLAAIELRHLQQINEQLTVRLAQLRHERHELLNGEMMWIKIQVSLAKRERRDYLREMANQLDRDYSAYLDRLDALRRQL